VARRGSPALAFQDDQALSTPGAVRDRLIRSMVRQGARDVRLNVIYGRVKQQGYGQLDETVNYLRAHGLHPQMTIMGTPRYMPNAPRELSWANGNPALMGLFAKEVAGHFKGRVRRYSVGNEPNYSGFNYGANTNPEAAGRMYRHQFQAGEAGIKGVDPSAQVLLGEMTSTPNAKRFLQAVFAGKPLRASGFAYHPYEATKPGTWDINNLQDLQSTLASYKRQGKFQTFRGGRVPLYLTEFGDHLGMAVGHETTAAHRRRFFEEGYAKAKAAGARQLLQYQLVPTANRQPGKWAWDTSIGDTQGNVPVLNRGLRLRRR
jgi:hypothetical protein